MKKITLDDLAKELKISKGTVDRAIHNRPGVSPKTKAKVLDLVKKYNYRPDKVARVMSLKPKNNNRSRLILRSLLFLAACYLWS